MLTDAEDLQSLLGKNSYQMLITIGHHPDHINQCLSEGKSYKIVVFPASSALEGTWDSREARLPGLPRRGPRIRTAPILGHRTTGRLSLQGCR